MHVTKRASTSQLLFYANIQKRVHVNTIVNKKGGSQFAFLPHYCTFQVHLLGVYLFSFFLKFYLHTQHYGQTKSAQKNSFALLT